MSAPPLQLRFWRKVLLADADDCWTWTSATNPNGYGVFTYEGRTVKAHRMALFLMNGAWPTDEAVDHTCHNDSPCAGGPTCPHRRCCNPRHLEDVSKAENSRRGKAGGKRGYRVTACPSGHEFNERNTGFTRDGDRYCRRCAADRAAARRAARKVTI